MIRRIYMNPHPHQRTLNRLLTPRIQHLGPHTRIIGIPTDKHQLRRGPPIVRLKAHVNQAVATVVLGHVGDKVIVRLGEVAGGVDYDFFLVFNLVDKVSELVGGLPEFELLEGGGYLVVYLYARCLSFRVLVWWGVTFKQVWTF